jgi:Na+-translocating ferredoxin:NAD+ oxidoreductase RnfC subunit
MTTPITVQQVKDHGVVGAGGAGFPAHVKLASRADLVVVNAAECEPLLHKDKEILAHHADIVMAGTAAAMAMVGAREAIVGIKNKHHALIEGLAEELPPGVRITPVGDFYPAGDEVTLVYETTGRSLQPGALPGSVGCVVQNVETLYNIGLGEPVTDKVLTIAGEVDRPVTVRVPIGISLRDLLAHVTLTRSDVTLVIGGLMMGYVEDDWERVVTKTTGGVIVLPDDHHAVRTLRRSKVPEQIDRIAKASCDQCSFCTELCPRYLMGHPIRPETSMRNRMYDIGDDTLVNPGSLFCCECNLCTMVACPEQLDPRGAALIEKRLLRERGTKWTGPETSPHPMNAYRKVPTARLIQKLGVAGYTNEAPLSDVAIVAARVTIPLSQHIGTPAEPVVRAGERVRRGALIGHATGRVSANVHASIDGSVTSVDSQRIVIEG